MAGLLEGAMRRMRVRPVMQHRRKQRCLRREILDHAGSGHCHQAIDGTAGAVLAPESADATSTVPPLTGAGADRSCASWGMGVKIRFIVVPGGPGEFRRTAAECAALFRPTPCLENSVQ